MNLQLEKQELRIQGTLLTPHLSQPSSTFQAAVATGEATLELHLQLCDLNTLGKLE